MRYVYQLQTNCIHSIVEQYIASNKRVCMLIEDSQAGWYTWHEAE